MLQNSSSRRRGGRDRKNDIRKIAAAGGILLLGAGVVGGIRVWEDRAYQNEGQQPNVTAGPVISDLKTVEKDGVIWTEKRNIRSYLFMGIDNSGEVDEVTGVSGGRNDVDMLVVIDDKNETWRILQLNRDSMVYMPMIDEHGDFVSTIRQQLCLAYTYGSGGRDSAQNVCQTVSGLLDGAVISGYAALNMGALPVLNDAVGGVTVTMQKDYTDIDPSFQEGAVITLQGDQAFRFIRARMYVEDGTNLSRMERQRQYLSGLSDRFAVMDAKSISEVYEMLEDYIVTDMKNDLIVSTAEKMQRYEQLDILTVDGELVIENDLYQYLLDKDSLQDVILQLYYEPQN